MTELGRHLDAPVSNRTRGQLEVSLDVPNLGQAVGFYSAVFDGAPSAVERRMVWFDVPESALRIELREALTPTATRLRLCTEPRRLQVVAARLRESGVVIAQAGLTARGCPRAISFHDPGRNCWELYASAIADLPSRPSRHPTGRYWRSLTDSVRTVLRAASALEARFAQERTSAQNLPRRYRHSTANNERSGSIGQ